LARDLSARRRRAGRQQRRRSSPAELETLIARAAEGAGARRRGQAPPILADPAASHAARVFLAGEALLDVGSVGAGKRGARRVTDALVQTMRQGGIDPKQRRRAGLLLGDLGWVPDDLDAWIEIPPGPFLYGDDKETREIPDRYWIGKYPVTNLQFARFIAAGWLRAAGAVERRGLGLA
jgi:hypothetical protein